jgi:hypothetical protein
VFGSIGGEASGLLLIETDALRRVQAPIRACAYPTSSL